jgi:hypothetical protein
MTNEPTIGCVEIGNKQGESVPDVDVRAAMLVAQARDIILGLLRTEVPDRGHWEARALEWLEEAPPIEPAQLS